MQINRLLFPRLHYWLLLLIPFTILGFYPTYFSRLQEPMDLVYHVHAFFMVLWVVLAIVQPFLIHQKRTSTHKQIGKLSYLIMPIVFISGFLVIRHTYNNFIEAETTLVINGVSRLTASEIGLKAFVYSSLGLLYWIWLVLFYSLAILYKKQVLFHATYMFAAILTLLGPTVDRLLFNVCSYLNVPYHFLIENAVFIFIILLLLLLTAYQRIHGNSMKPSIVSLVIYSVGVLIFLYIKTVYS